MYIFVQVCRVFPESLSPRETLTAVYGKDIKDKKTGTIRVLFHNAKHKLSAIGIEMKSERGLGYSIDIPNSENEFANYLIRAVESGDV